MIIRIIQPFFLKSHPDEEEIALFKKEIEAWQNSEKQQESDIITGKSRSGVQFISLKTFNPNEVSETFLRGLGLSNTACQAWVNYLKNGGKFYRKEDLLKIYGIDSVWYKKIEPFLYLPGKPEYYTRETIKLSIELNKATAAELQKLPGIGPVLSERIINYRNLLGGYVHTLQIKEVYGISDSLYRIIKDQMVLDTLPIKKINLNQADEYTLSRHPYIDEYCARSILTFRKMNGKITGYQELSENRVMPDSVVKKLIPYCTF